MDLTSEGCFVGASDLTRFRLQLGCKQMFRSVQPSRLTCHRQVRLKSSSQYTEFKTKRQTQTGLPFIGASDLTRTGDLLITSEMHYRLCYTSIYLGT